MSVVVVVPTGERLLTLTVLWVYGGSGFGRAKAARTQNPHDTPMVPLKEMSASHSATAEPHDTIEKVLDVMTTQGIESVVIMEKGRLVGIVTDGDLLRMFYEHVFSRAHDDPAHLRKMLDTPVSRAMTLHPICVHVGTSASEALALMRKKNCKHLVLERASGEFVGILERKSLLRMVLHQE